MSDKTYFAVSATVFAVVGLSHLVRALLGITIDVDGTQFPLWASWGAAVVLAVLAFQGFRRAAR